jgi:hypothetical protein
MSTSFQTTDLDFNNIKNSLKNYFKQRDEFSDYDFEASGLSNILDVLAYNTHYNALLANFALNEAYITSAQLRPSIISIAQTLGYNIRSRSASRANVNLSLNLTGASIIPSSITIPVGTKFTTSVDGISYTFQTTEKYTATNDGNNVFVFMTADGSENIPIYEGILKTKTFIVSDDNERQIFVIPDETIDTNIITVKVFDTFSSTSFTSYTDITNTQVINPESTFYKLYETPNGYYELSFGDGITTGKKPTVGNKVEIQYLSTVGPDANSAITFTPISQVNVNGVNYNLIVNPVAASHGGAFKQSIESIRHNAPLTFASQNRLVTAEDYETQILSNYSSVLDVVAWGGEDNDVPNYGVVFISLLFSDGVSNESKISIQNSIKTVLNENLAILSIDVSFVDPVIVYLEIETEFDFNPDLTSVTRSTMESRVLAKINEYVNNNLKTFNGTFRKSNLNSELDDISTSILSTATTVKLQQRLIPATQATEENSSRKVDYTLNFPVPLASPSNVSTIVSSTSFKYNDLICSVKNKLGSNTLQIVDGNNNLVVDNIGNYDETKGKINLTGFAPGIISSGDNFIKFTVKPANDNVIKPLRNYYYDIDTSASFANSIIDRGNNSVSL